MAAVGPPDNCAGFEESHDTQEEFERWSQGGERSGGFLRSGLALGARGT